MLIPAVRDIVAVRGGTFDVQFELYQDKSQTQPFPIGALVAKFTIDGIGTFNSSSGVTVDAPNGVVSVKLLANVTSGLTADSYGYRLSLEDPSDPNDINFPIIGKLQVKAT